MELKCTLYNRFELNVNHSSQDLTEYNGCQVVCLVVNETETETESESELKSVEFGGEANRKTETGL